MKKSKITKRELAAVLRESAVAPNKPGPLKVIIDVGDVQYYMRRAIELVTLTLTSPTVNQQEYYLEQAIFLLGVAKHTVRTNQLDENQAKRLSDLISSSLNSTKSETEDKKVNTVIGRSKIPGDPY